MSNKNFFESFKVEKPDFQLLTEGDHQVRVLRMEMLNSFQQYNGAEKDKLPAWANATPQLAITVVSTEEGKSGGLTHRFNGCGYKKYDELTKKEKASGKFEDVGGYACITDSEGDLIRVESEEKTKQCGNILNQFAASIDIEEGENLVEGIEEAIAKQTSFRVTVSSEMYEGKEQLRLAKFKSAKSVAAKSATFAE